MNCKECAENLTAYMDDELLESDSRKVAKHIDHCPPCAEEYQSLRKAGAFVVSHYEDLDLEPGKWDSLRDRLREEDKPRPIWGGFPWLQTAAAAAATLLLVVGGWRFVEGRRTEAALQDYMSQYIQSRSALVGRGEIPQSSRRHPEFSQNPFVDEDEMIENRNPFLGDGR
jgi:hypothetical protein